MKDVCPRNSWVILWLLMLFKNYVDLILSICVIIFLLVSSAMVLENAGIIHGHFANV